MKRTLLALTSLVVVMFISACEPHGWGTINMVGNQAPTVPLDTLPPTTTRPLYGTYTITVIPPQDYTVPEGDQPAATTRPLYGTYTITQEPPGIDVHAAQSWGRPVELLPNYLTWVNGQCIDGTQLVYLITEPNCKGLVSR